MSASRRRPLAGAGKTAPIAAPRLPPAHALRATRALALGDEGAYTDLAVTGARLTGLAARGVRLERVVLHDVDLSGARLDRLVLADVRLEHCDLANGVWRGAAIDRAELIDCRLTGLDLAEASLRHV